MEQLIYGATKKIQSNGYFESFAYDGIGRLKEIRDSDNNILKTYQYNYADITCFPNPMNIYGSLSVCIGNSVSLTATGCSGTTNWYNSSTTLITTGSTNTTPVLSSNATFYTSCVIGGEESSKSSILIDVNTNGSPNPPSILVDYLGNTYNPTLTVVSGSLVTLNSADCSGITIWQGGTITGQTGTSINLTPTADATYNAICSLSQCTSSLSNPIQIRVCNDINEPNETYSQAASLNVGNTINRCLVVNDSDFYQISISGNTYFIKVIPFLGSFTGFYNLSTSIADNILTIETTQDILSIGSTDTKLYLYAADGVTQLAYNDDFGGSFFSKINYPLPISASNIAWSNTIRTKECITGGQITMKVYVTGLISGATAQFSTDGGTTWQNANIGSNGFSFTRSSANVYQIFQARASDYTANVISSQYHASRSSINWGANSCSNTSGNVTFNISVTGVTTDSYAEFTIDGTNWFQANVGTNGYQVTVPYGSGGSQYFGARPADNRTNNAISGNLTKCSAGTPSNIVCDNTRRTKICNNGQTTMSIFVSGLTSPATAQFSTNGGTTWQNATIGSDEFNVAVTTGNTNQNFLARATDALSNIIWMDYNAGCTTAINWSTNSCTPNSGNSNFFVSVIGLATDSYAEFSIDNTNWYRANVGSNGYNVSVPYGTGGLKGFNARPADNPSQTIGGFLNKCQ